MEAKGVLSVFYKGGVLQVPVWLLAGTGALCRGHHSAPEPGTMDAA